MRNFNNIKDNIKDFFSSYSPYKGIIMMGVFGSFFVAGSYFLGNYQGNQSFILTKSHHLGVRMEEINQYFPKMTEKNQELYQDSLKAFQTEKDSLDNILK